MGSREAGAGMTAIQLVNQWRRERRIDPRFYELLSYRLTHRPYSLYSTDISGISARRLTEMITSGEIGKVRGIGDSRLGQLRRLVTHHAVMYRDREQMMRYGAKL